MAPIEVLIITFLRSKEMLKSEIKFWEAVILSNKKIEPRTKEQEAAYDIALYYVSQNKEKIAA